MKLKFDNVSKFLLACLFLVGFSSLAYGQRTISGTVTDAENGEPLIGASVLVSGTTTGTITDIDGSYRLSVPEGYSEVVFSYTGYTSQNVTLGATNVVDIALSPGSLLDEVVVVGYGTQSAKEVTSAITSLEAEDFNAGNVNDPTQLIQGRVAGLVVAKPGSDPNGSTTIRLRGLSTLGANTSPLIVIDGVIGASLETVDPNDIASIDVLKDGSAAAIYGTRASSGVIIITTKKGAQGTAKVNYNGYVSAESVARSVDVATAEEFAQYRPSSDRGASTNWLDEITRTGISHAHNLSISGGSAQTTYRASLNYRDINGVGLVSGFDQLNGRLGITQKAFNDRLTLAIDATATNRDANFGLNEAFRYASTYNPTAPVFFADETNPLFDTYGGYYQEVNFDYFNPLAIVEQSSNTGVRRDLLLSGRATYELIDGLDASIFYSVLRENDSYAEYYQKAAFFRGINRNGLARRTEERKQSQLFEITGNYDVDFGGNNSLQLLAGYSYQDFDFQNVFVEAGNFISDDLTVNRLDAAQDFADARATVNSTRNNYRVIAFFGRANFNFDNTYFLSVSARQEGSSRFGANNKWQIFPGVSAGVTLSNLFDVSGIDNLKLRAGYGETGNLPPESYLSQLRFEPQGSFFYNGGFVPAYAPTRNANPDLRWETKGEFNVGLDFALGDYLIVGSFDYYNRRTRDLLYEVVVPVPPNLAERTWANLEDVVLRNQGIEVSVGLNIGNGETFSWNPNIVASTFKTILDTLDVSDPTFAFFSSGDAFLDPVTTPGAPGLNNSPTVAVYPGQELGQLYGPVYAGVDENGEFIFEDLNGDGTTDADGDGLVDAADKTTIGNGLPNLSIGLSNNFSFGNFGLSFFLRGDFGHDLANMYRVFYEPLGSRSIENLVVTEYFNENLTATPQFSSYYIESADYVVLDNATLSYTFDLPEDSSFSNFRLYLTGQNLFWITNYSGVDPSPRYADPGSADNGGRPTREFNPSPLAPGLDRRTTYFNSRTILFGINVGF